MKQAIALRHVAFEDAGSFAEVLRERGYALSYLEAGVADLAGLDPLAAELLLVLGGPVGAYEESFYPFIGDEIRLLEKRLAADRPTVGICLGAQLMARALGARVYPGHGKELGWSPLILTPAGETSPARHLAPERTSMLHWHGDTFDLPDGATLLASTGRYAQQIFSWGKGALAFQCHPEAQTAHLERWYIGHACELGGAGIDIPALRAESRRLGPTLELQGQACFAEWLAGV
ncbi:MAG: glutamine amidotransferase [Magnetococcales bacterium]|nr:glutamine amidotransferase [Magnetococcales bacterium]